MIEGISIAGKRAGLKHESNGDEETTRSGLFMEAVRIIEEMRDATNGLYPRIAVWENVPGAFSSNKGEDFRTVIDCYQNKELQLLVYQMDTQVRVGKDSLGKSSTGEDNMPDSDEPAPPPAPKKTKPTRHKYGEYKNVLLSDEEMDKLKDEFPSDWPDRVERLSAYMASHGKVYKNHLATIRNWAKKDAEARPNIQHGATGKTTKAEELEDFYRMADEFGRGL